MHNAALRNPENLPSLILVVIIAVLVMFFNIFARSNITDCDNFICYHYADLFQLINNSITEIYDSIVSGKSYCFGCFNNITYLQETAGSQSKERIITALSDYQVPRKIANNLLCTNRFLCQGPIIYDGSHVHQLDSGIISTSKYNQGSIHLKPPINKVITMDNFSTYKNYDYAFTLRYPSSWSFKEINRFSSEHDFLVVRFFPNTNSTSGNLVNVSIFVDESVNNRSLKGYSNERIYKYNKSPGFDSINRSAENSHLSLHPAYNLSLSETGADNRRLNSIEIGTVIGGKGFIIRSTANDNQYSLHKNDIDLIINSFRLIGNPL